MIRIVNTIILAGLMCPAVAFPQTGTPPKAEEIFEQRIMPIFRSPNPSSCVQCHLSSVDLKNYIKPSSDKTFVSLRDQGMINVDSPDKSKILTLIQMGEDDFDKPARRIHEKVRQQEFEAFSAWIVSCCKDKRMLDLPKMDAAELAGPETPDEVIRHGRKGRLMNSFVRNIWSQRLRCFPCHTPHEIKPDQPKVKQRYDKLVSEYGDRMNLFGKTPLETMNKWLVRTEPEGDDALPLINLDSPTKSLIVLKPTAKLPARVDGKFESPSYKVPVSHMGGLKMHLNDPSYKAFVAWIKDYSKLKSGKYETKTDLPLDNWFATKKVLRLKEIPKSWPVGTVVQLKPHRWLADQNKWSAEPVAFTQGTITPRGMVNGALFLLAPTDQDGRRKWATIKNRLPAGKYLVKVYADTKKKIDDSPEAMLGKEDYLGSVLIENAQWQIGFPKAETISFSQLKRGE